MVCEISIKGIKEKLESWDKFGKEAKLYYKGQEQKSIKLGIVFTILYYFIYIGYLIYKLIRFFKKQDFLFYDTISYQENPPSINLTQDNFYGGFDLENPLTYDPFVDETIYFPKAYFKKLERNGNDWNAIIKEIKLVNCTIDKFGKFYQKKFSNNSLNNLYCLENVNETLMGHFSYDVYSFFYIQLFPCINTTENNNHCKPKEIIDYYLEGTFVCMEFENVELNPINYSTPVMPRNQDIYFTVGKKLFKEIHIFYQILNVETDLDIIGIDEIQNIRNNQYLKFKEKNEMINLIEEDIYETGEPFCDITIKLYDQILNERRTYTKLLTIWGDVGGLMESISSFFSTISSSIIDLLYELAIVNNLFGFNIKNTNKKLIILKKSKTLNERVKYANNVTNAPSKKKGVVFKRNYTYVNSTFFINNGKSKNLKNSNNNIYASEKDKIRFNKLCIYCCCLCVRKIKNINNNMLKEGIKQFSEKMDIFTIYKQLNQKEKKEEYYKREEYYKGEEYNKGKEYNKGEEYTIGEENNKEEEYNKEEE